MILWIIPYLPTAPNVFNVTGRHSRPGRHASRPPPDQLAPHRPRVHALRLTLPGHAMEAITRSFLAPTHHDRRIAPTDQQPSIASPNPSLYPKKALSSLLSRGVAQLGFHPRNHHTTQSASPPEEKKSRGKELPEEKEEREEPLQCTVAYAKPRRPEASTASLSTSSMSPPHQAEPPHLTLSHRPRRRDTTPGRLRAPLELSIGATHHPHLFGKPLAPP
jgi:hypothetical protein